MAAFILADIGPLAWKASLICLVAHSGAEVKCELSLCTLWDCVDAYMADVADEFEVLNSFIYA
jgi:hypothetical protein